MNVTLRAPQRAGSIGRNARGPISAAVSVLIVLLVIVGGLTAIGSAPRSSGPPAASRSSGLTTALPPNTHGDLVVLPGQTFVIRPPTGSRTYYQGGNITVEAGGTLDVLNVTLSFVQFVSPNGTPIERLSHIYRFVDEGAVNFYNSTLTTDVQVLNAWAKLNLTVTGDLTALNSTLAFPGWLNVEGASADLTLNSSHITANPIVPTLHELTTILGDTMWAPYIDVTNGAQFNAFNSTINDTYADNTIGYGIPQPVPLGLPSNPYNTLLTVGDNNFSFLPTPTDSANLTQDWLYPNADFQAGNLILTWNNPSKLVAYVQPYVWYNLVRYPIGAPLEFQNGSAGGYKLPLPADLLQAITDDGVLNYLNWTGDFGAGASRIALDFVLETAGPAVVNVTAVLSLLPTVHHDLVVAGAGTTLNSVDTQFDLNWNTLPANSTTQTPPLPWASNKLLLEDGAIGYLANATITNPIENVFSTSAVLPDASSEAYFYRWAQFNVTGRGGVLDIPNAQASAFYAYNTNQTDNKTANRLNDLSTANPQIWGYVQYWDHQHGVPSYGLSNVSGIASILLASSNITLPTLPDGYFLGGYHVGIAVPAPGVGSHWFNWSVSPYPVGVDQIPPAVAGPDFGPLQKFPQYFGGAVVESTTVLINGVASRTVNLGQTVAVKLEVEDIGSAPLTQIAADLYYNGSLAPKTLLASYENTSANLTTPGQTTSFTLSWKATTNVTGFYSSAFDHNLTVVLEWNYNETKLAGGNTSENVSLKFQPTTVTVVEAAFANGVPSSFVYPGQVLGIQVTVSDVGNATISQVSATLYYAGVTLLASYENSDLHLTAPGQETTFTLDWTVTLNVTKFNAEFNQYLNLSVTWNKATPWLGNGSSSQLIIETFMPSGIHLNATVLANGVPSSTVDLGQTLGIRVIVSDVGNGTIVGLVALLNYNSSKSLAGLIAANVTFDAGLDHNGQNTTMLLEWKATENTTGLNGTFQHFLNLTVGWNFNNTYLGNGSVTIRVPVIFAPSMIRFTSFSTPPTTLSLSQAYISTGTIEYNGSHEASLALYAVPLSGGLPIEISGGVTLPGSFSLVWVSLTGVLSPGTTYTLYATAVYNTRNTTYDLPGTYAVPPTPTSPTNFFTQKILGLPLWIWLAIAAAAAVAIVAFLLFARREAAGKLVECGECGNLIPEDATVCPKCGAEFETDLIRCSRCASTIPADSKFCPECAAQLLGTPGEAKSDPEKQAYADFTEKYRAEAKRELGDNYSEGAFWDWWKRQPTYTPFSQWSLQQGQGTARAGMTAPPAGTVETPETPPTGTPPPKGGAGWSEAAGGAPPSTTAAPPPSPPATAVPPPAPGGAGLKPCPSCGKEIPSEYLVCPFCNAVTQ